ncbi:hypothetical protein [Bacillus cabrialesii]|uniref:hypothetical protein n=1 Tax=Bacillus cabrialesii TaxID=2487276 RepID=UPI0028FBDAA5|nr:hypothetical protein [Bacillus cabrialesii]MDU0154012.1 hypothetical protein [Bacillus cabrialesii]
MKKYTDIELELMKETARNEIPVLLAHVPEIAKVSVAFYEEYKNNQKVEKQDVVPLAAKMTASCFGLG